MPLDSDSSRLAKEHWDWVVRWLEMVYTDAFTHGYKHGAEVKQSRRLLNQTGGPSQEED